MKETILAVSGKPGLYRLVSRGKANLILEALDETKKRVPAFASDRVTSLSDIAMYTDDEDMPLWQVLKNVAEKESAQPTSIDFKKANAAELVLILQRFCHHTTATEYATVISANSFSGIIFLLKAALQTSKRPWLRQKVTILTTALKNNHSAICDMLSGTWL